MPSIAGRRSLIAVSAGIALIGAMLGGAYYAKTVADGRAALASVEPQERVVRVVVADVARDQIPIVVETRGFLEGLAEVRVHAEVGGEVIERPVEDGQAVQSGDLLCRIDETLYKLAVEQAEAVLHTAEADRDQARAAAEAAAASVEQAQVAQRNARIEFDRVERLHADQNAPQIEYDRAETTLHGMLAAVREAEAARRRAAQQLAGGAAQVALAKARLEEARENLRRCAIRSPIAGRVDRMLVEAGEYLALAQPVGDVIRLDRMKLQTELTAADLALLGDAARATVRIDALPDRSYSAVVDHVAPRADPRTRKFRVELRLSNDDGRLLSGMFAWCRLTSERQRKLTSIPTASVVTAFGREYCRVIAPDEDGVLRARLRPVETRPLPDRLDVVELTEGLSAGDRVVVSAHAELRDGTAVEVVDQVDAQPPDALATARPEPRR